MLALQLNSHFLLGLPNRCGKEVTVLGLEPATWQCHVTAPGIPGSLSSADEQDALWFGSDDQGYCRPDQRRIGVAIWPILGQAST
jgi:hypothetical protein